MVNSFKDAYVRAQKKLLEDSDGKVKQDTLVDAQSSQPSKVSPTKPESFSALLTPNQKRTQREDMRKSVQVTYGNTLWPINRREGKQKQSAPIGANSSPVPVFAQRVPQTVKMPPAVARTSPPVVTVAVSSHAACKVGLRDSKPTSLLPRFETAGRATQIHVGKPTDEREVVIGLDFGTSCVKVVIGDPALGKAFAVPFCNTEGIARYLLPSRLCQTGNFFSLEDGTHTYRDLKLSLLASPEDPILQQRLVAFLALVIRRARGWLLVEQVATYQQTHIVWKLTVGLSAAQHHLSPLSELFERLSHLAWVVSGAPTQVTDTEIQSHLGHGSAVGATGADVEVTVVPEIAAQIYGFVASNSFDKQAPNIYLMADVGSGTIDSSLFRVKQGKGGRWDFEFYTSVVESNGVSNLHRHRVNWWTDALEKAGAPRRLIDDLNAIKLITDQQFSTPESYKEYFSGVDAKLRGSVKSPDEEFFNLRVLAQVQGKTLWRTWKDNLLPQSSLVNIPFFMCGGGVRMSYYQQLESRLSSMPGYSWLKAECWMMGVPDDLVAEGVAVQDYDRLSVAYGMSRLEVGKIIKALPQPKLTTPLVNIWRDNYVDRDQC